MLLALILSQAHASSYYFLDSNARGIGRGGANIIGADDLSAQYYNPAALMNITRPELNLNVWTVGQYINFDRADDYGPDGTQGTDDDSQGVFQPVENEAAWIIEPTLGFATPLRGLSPALKGTTLAIGMYLPTSPNMAYDPYGAQRYSLISSGVKQIYAGPSVAQKIGPVTIGAGLQYTFLQVDESLAAVATIDGTPTATEGSDNPTNDINIDVSTIDPFALSWNAGIIVTPVPWLQFGGSVQPAIHYEAPGSLTTTFNSQHIFLSALAEDTYTDDDVTLVLTMPWIVRGGVQVIPSDKARIELSGTWTQWSKLSDLTITDVDLTLTHKEGQPLLPVDLTVTDDIVQKTGFQDAVSLRLGGDYKINDIVTVRAGANYESSAIPTSWQGSSIVDGNKFGFGLGGTVTIAKRVSLDASFGEQFLPTREITDSEVTQVVVAAGLTDPYPTTVGTGKVIGNGTLKSHVTYAGVGATVFFGAGDK